MRYKLLASLLLFSVAVASGCYGCEFVDCFHQVTALRGRVVGKSLGPLQFRWLRRSFAVKNAALTLYEYRSPAMRSDLKRIAEVKSDSRGAFEFGKVEVGHYYLNIRANEPDGLEDWFEVEVTGKVKSTHSILLDISPVQPDCSGGHDFIETKA